MVAGSTVSPAQRAPGARPLRRALDGNERAPLLQSIEDIELGAPESDCGSPNFDTLSAVRHAAR